ncbi:tetratricopeptide repeat protein [bacterium]|nr:MAG: tetratricopeptide repeat protein [bacterium]
MNNNFKIKTFSFTESSCCAVVCLFLFTVALGAQNPEKAKKHFDSGRNAYLKFTFDDYKEAVGHYEKALAEDSNFAPAYAALSEAHALLGFELENLGQPAENHYSRALTNAQKSMDKDSTLAMAYRAMAQACLNVNPKKFGQLIYEELTRALELDSTDAESHYLMWLHTDNTNTESPWITKSIRFNDRFFQSHYSLGLLCAKQKNFEQAVVHYKKCAEINPKNYRTYFSLGNAYSQQKKYDLAIPEYENALKLNNKNTEAYFYLGLAYYYKDNNKKAKKNLEKYLELSPVTTYRKQAEDMLNDIKQQ